MSLLSQPAHSSLRNLSGGQRQLLALARIFLSKPDVLLLDEATSALDAKTEAKVKSCIQRRLPKATKVIVAYVPTTLPLRYIQMTDLLYRHRLGSIMNADMIFVFGKDDEGCVVLSEAGTHVELLKRKGMYAELWDSYTGKNGLTSYGSYRSGTNTKKHDPGVLSEAASDSMRLNAEAY